MLQDSWKDCLKSWINISSSQNVAHQNSLFEIAISFKEFFFMKKIIYLFTLFALSISLTIAHAASPTYDDEPPSYIWGSGGLNPQTSGTPNKSGEQRIDDSIQNMNITVGSISVDTSNIESDVSEIKIDISSISSNIGELITSQSASDVTIGSISVDTSKIESYLKTETGTANSPNPKSIAEMLTWNSWAEYQPYPIIATHTIGNMVATISESLIYKLRSDIYPYNVLSTHSLAEIAYNIKEDVNSLKQSTDTQPKVFGTKRISASANTTVQIRPMAGYEIDPTSVSHRIFIELRATDPDADFYIGFNSNITDSDGRPVKGRILLNMPQSQNLYIYHTNTSAIAIQQTEGWR